MRPWLAACFVASILLPGGVFAGDEPAPDPSKETPPDTLYQQALNLFQNREFDKAEKMLDQVVAERPDYFPGRYLRGACRLAAGRFGPAVEDFDWVVKGRPSFAKAIAQRGRARLGLEAWDEAIGDLEEALRLDSSEKGWKQDLEQARMLKRGAAESGPGKLFPPVPLVAPASEVDAGVRKIPEGLLLPLISAAERAGRLFGGGPGLFRGAWIVFFSSVDSPKDLAYLSEIQESLPLLAAKGFSIVAVSPDPPEKIARLRELKGLSFPIFSDSMGRAAWKLGILNLRYAEVGDPLPSLFVVDPGGTVRLRKVTLDARRREAIEKVLMEADESITRVLTPGDKK